MLENGNLALVPTFLPFLNYESPSFGKCNPCVWRNRAWDGRENSKHPHLCCRHGLMPSQGRLLENERAVVVSKVSSVRNFSRPSRFSRERSNAAFIFSCLSQFCRCRNSILSCIALSCSAFLFFCNSMRARTSSFAACLFSSFHI